MSVRCEVIPFIVAAAAMGLVIGVGLRLCGKSLHAGVTAGVVVAGLLSVYMLYFFRDPERTPPAGESLLPMQSHRFCVRPRHAKFPVRGPPPHNDRCTQRGCLP